MSSESPTPFRTVLRGYEPAQVDQHIRELTTSLTALQQQSEQLQRHVQELQSRTDAAEAAVISAQEDSKDRAPTFTEFGERVAKILSLADDEARDLVTRARTDAEAIVADGEAHAKKVRKEAEQYSLDWKSEVDAEAARILEEARTQADDMRDEAERDATARRSEAQALYEQERAKSAQAAAAFETTLAERRGKVEQEFAARTALAEQQLAAVTDRAAQVQREADRSRSEAERLSQQQLADANRQAQEIVAAAKDKAERIRAESERELAAATQRRDSINAQLTNVRQMLATLSGQPAMPLDLLADANRQAQEIVAAAKDKSERIRAESERELAAATQRRDSINAQLTNVRQMLATLSGSPAMPLDLLTDDDAEATSNGSKKN